MKNIANIEELEKFLGMKLGQFDSGIPMAHQGIHLSRVCKFVESEIRNGNPAAVCVAFRVIAEDPRLPFGKLIKSGFARALKQRVDMLSEMQRRGLIEKTFELLGLEFCPRETEDYCKLIKKFGHSELESKIDNDRATDKKSRMLLGCLSSHSS